MMRYSFTVALYVCLALQPVVTTAYTSSNNKGHLQSAGDPVAGKALYNRCIGCHSFDRNRTGPKHCGLFGRKAGTVDGFEYSAAMRQLEVVWDSATLDEFLAAPIQYVPGTYMGFAGIKDDVERRDLIAYMRTVSSSNECD